MQPTYFASFLLGESALSPLPSISDGVEIIASWMFENKYRPLPRPDSWPNLSAPLEYPAGSKIQVLQLQDDAQQFIETFAIRFEHPDQQSRFWRTDCVLSRVADPEPAIRFAISVAVGGASDHIYALRPPSSRPRVVREIMAKFGGRERYPLKSTFIKIPTAEAERFSQFLLDSTRTLPVVFLSRTNDNEHLLCNPNELAGKLVGVAYVCVAESAQLSWNITEYIDNHLNAYDGTIRIYWPRMKPDDHQYRHRWWNKHQLSSLNRPISDELLRLIASASVTRYVPGRIHWEDIERESTRRTFQRLQSAGVVSSEVSEEWLKQYETDLAALGTARQELASLSDKLLEREEEVRRWRQMYLQALRGHPTEADNIGTEAPSVENAAGAIEAAAIDFADQLEIVQGRISKETALFEEPELLYASLKWLATTYRDAKIGTRSCPDLDKSCRESCEFRYNGHQSEITMGMYATDYELTRDGVTVKLREHIRFGTSTEPRHTIRMAFFFDNKTNKVVIGYIGQHQTTRKSN